MFLSWGCALICSSVADLGDLAQLVRRCRRKAEELKVGGYLLKQHVHSDLGRAPAGSGGGEQWRYLALHHHLADERRSSEPGDVERQRILGRHTERRSID